MSILKKMVEESFDDDNDKEVVERVNKNLEQIKASLSDTNKKFITYEILMYIFIFSYHLVLIEENSKFC